MSAPAWSALLRDAAARLTAVGIDSPRVDAELLLAHVLGLDRGALLARVFAGACLLYTSDAADDVAGV